MAKKRIKVELPDYGDPEVNLLAQIGDALERMTTDQRWRAFHWFKSKYSKEWPSDQTY